MCNSQRIPSTSSSPSSRGHVHYLGPCTDNCNGKSANCRVAFQKFHKWLRPKTLLLTFVQISPTSPLVWSRQANCTLAELLVDTLQLPLPHFVLTTRVAHFRCRCRRRCLCWWIKLLLLFICRSFQLMLMLMFFHHLQLETGNRTRIRCLGWGAALLFVRL